MNHVGAFPAIGDDGCHYIIDVWAERERIETRSGIRHYHGRKILRVGFDEVLPMGADTYELTQGELHQHTITLRPNDPTTLKRTIYRAW
jgi:hypothetical protein